MTKDELITARIEDKISQCRDGYYVRTAAGTVNLIIQGRKFTHALLCSPPDSNPSAGGML